MLLHIVPTRKVNYRYSTVYSYDFCETFVENASKSSETSSVVSTCRVLDGVDAVVS